MIEKNPGILAQLFAELDVSLDKLNCEKPVKGGVLDCQMVSPKKDPKLKYNR